jgi:hypothetical protein
MLDSIEDSLRSLRQLDFGAINKGITNLLVVVSHLGEKWEELDLKKLVGNADSLMAELKSAGSKVQDAVEDVRRTLKSMDLEKMGKDARVLLAGLEDSNGKLQTVLDNLGAAPVSQTVEDLRQAIGALTGVLQELKHYPSGFFLGEPPAPARGVQTPRK